MADIMIPYRNQIIRHDRSLDKFYILKSNIISRTGGFDSLTEALDYIKEIKRKPLNIPVAIVEYHGSKVVRGLVQEHRNGWVTVRVNPEREITTILENVYLDNETNREQLNLLDWAYTIINANAQEIPSMRKKLVPFTPTTKKSKKAL